MKKLLLPLILLTAFENANAAKWRVNNTTGVNANFTTLAAAITAATAGDTIYVEPSVNSVGGGTLNKQLTIIGNGYFTSTPSSSINTMNPNLQANMASSTVSGITFDVGSQNSTVMGLLVNGDVYTYVSNVNIKRCQITGHIRLSNYQSGNYVNVSNIDIRQCVLAGGIVTTQFSTNSGAVGITNLNIQNNILSTYFYVQISLPSGISGFMMNNVFYTPYYALDVYNFQLNNNIMLSGGVFNTNNNVYFNNIAGNSAWGTANSNQANVSTTSLFQNYGSGAADTSYVLNPSGPGIGAGFGSVNVGPYGGPDPYRKSGIPPVPSIYMFSAPATTTTSNLPVTISTRSND